MVAASVQQHHSTVAWIMNAAPAHLHHSAAEPGACGVVATRKVCKLTYAS